MSKTIERAPQGDSSSRAPEIRRLGDSEVDALQRSMPGSGRWIDGALLSYHHARLREQQCGDAVYLIAWVEDKPVGHVLVRWGGSHDGHLLGLGVRDPYVEGLAVKKEHWSRGIGTAIMLAAEQAARSHGHHALGLAVGVENERARRLYKRLGYIESGLGDFDARWAYVDNDATEQWGSERCTYLTKRLRNKEQT